ncbi:MAG TPA: orotidine-5'-phosphate decarboxylase [Caulobacteraceae bacterium]
MDFRTKLARAWQVSGTSLCVGLDPVIERMPAEFAALPKPVFAFNRFIIDLVGSRVAAFKPQAAHHAAVGAEDDLAQTIAYIRQHHPHAVLILDAKRGDIGSTAQMYAREAFERYDADAVTVNPYMGDDTIEPFIGHADRGAAVLCRTSNPDAGRFQTAQAEGEPLYLAIARRAETVWNRLGNVMLVVGATAPRELAAVRAAAPGVTILAPGFGEQGGSARDVVAAGRRADGTGLLVSASRSILYAGEADQVRAAVEEARRALAVTVDA